MADDQIEQINKILSPKPGGTGDDVYKFANAIDPREVSAEALNAGALTDEEFMMAEEFMNALPPEDQGSFLDRLMNDPRATMKSIMDTLGPMFGGGQEMLRRQMSNDNGSSFDNLVDRTLSGTGMQLKGPLSNSELEMLRQIQSGDERLGALTGIEGSGAMTDRELDAFRKMKMNMDVSPPSGPMTDRELDFIRQQQMDMNVSSPSGAMTDEERAIRRQRMRMDNSRGSISDMELMRIVDSRDGYQPPDSTNLKGAFSEKEISSMQSTRPLPSEERLYQLRRGR